MKAQEGPAFEAIRKALGKAPGDPITAEDLATIKKRDPALADKLHEEFRRQSFK
jgi:hypothetical protein